MDRFRLAVIRRAVDEVYGVWALSLLISTLVSVNFRLPETNATPSSHGWHARRSPLWHRRHTTLYDRSPRCPMSRGGFHSRRTDVWLTTETTLRGAEGTPGGGKMIGRHGIRQHLTKPLYEKLFGNIPIKLRASHGNIASLTHSTHIHAGGEPEERGSVITYSLPKSPNERRLRTEAQLPVHTSLPVGLDREHDVPEVFPPCVSMKVRLI
ncbi:hypothetical protein EYF80_048245 [Liparis tanakae]|uniref:Uncharacterized protein n=1 Tax=Liparis tanakae TaxID=230148 RepID=A0A4Z2FK10_9TELE|nr:hypothetical protein EYF80_048245 [Liparis tanakae]